MIEVAFNGGRRPLSGYRVVALIVVIVAVAVAIWFTFVGIPKNPTTVAQAEERVHRGVPLGSTRPEVEAWLESQGIEYGYSDNPQYESSVRDAGLDPDDLSGIVSGVIPDTDRSVLIEWAIQVVFFFDRDGRTVKHRVERFGTGP